MKFVAPPGPPKVVVKADPNFRMKQIRVRFKPINRLVFRTVIVMLVVLAVLCLGLYMGLLPVERVDPRMVEGKQVWVKTCKSGRGSMAIVHDAGPPRATKQEASRDGCG